MERERGFTLIELVVVVLILGALVFIAVPRIGITAREAKEAACAANQELMDKAIEMYFVEEGEYPATLSDVTENADYFPDGPPVCPLEGDYSINSKKRTSCSHSSGEAAWCG